MPFTDGNCAVPEGTKERSGESAGEGRVIVTGGREAAETFTSVYFVNTMNNAKTSAFALTGPIDVNQMETQHNFHSLVTPGPMGQVVESVPSA